MPVAYILDFPGASADDYDQVMEALGDDAEPAGALHHGSGVMDHGLRVIDVWETDAHCQAFLESTLGPVLQRLGFGEPQIQRYEISEIRDTASIEGAGFAHVVHLRGIDPEAYDALDHALLPDGGNPAGCRAQLGGPTDDGFVKIGFWDSRAARDTFLTEKVIPVMQAAGKTEPPAIEDLDLHNTIAPALARNAS